MEEELLKIEKLESLGIFAGGSPMISQY